MRVGAAQRELSRDQGARFLSPGYSLVTHQEWTRRFNTTVLAVGTHFWYKARDHHWWLGKISAHTTTVAQYIVRFLDDPGPVKLSPSRYTTAIGAERDSWCLQSRQGRPLQRGILRNIDESRESNLPTPSRLIDVPGSNGWFSTGAGRYWQLSGHSRALFFSVSFFWPPGCPAPTITVALT